MTTRLSDIFDLDELETMIDGGYVRRQINPRAPELSILNYTEKCQFEWVWNPVTLASRGLIYVTDTLEVLARPFPKFFNWDDGRQRRLPAGPALVSEKFDGSLGILYEVDGTPVIATRGSFASEQAEQGTKILWRMMRSEASAFKRAPGKTYLFEIIYPENRIVVDYGSESTLVLLDVIDIATGRTDLDEFESCAWPVKATKTHVSGFDPIALYDMTRAGDEGLVIHWPHQDYRVKMKRADYVELHKIVTGMSEKTVWTLLGAGKSVQEICEPLPDEFHSWVTEVAERLLTERTSVLAQAYTEFKEVQAVTEGQNRAMFAAEAQRRKHTPYIFMFLDGKDPSEAVWKTLKPSGAKQMKQISEDVA